MAWQMCIDLKENVLKCDNMQVPFLGEGDIPKHLMGMDDGVGDAMDVDAAAAGGAASGGQAGSTPGGADEPPAAAIEALTGMGFTREQAVTALRR
jgi:DNA damage-inducible protein 1